MSIFGGAININELTPDLIDVPYQTVISVSGSGLSSNTSGVLSRYSLLQNNKIVFVNLSFAIQVTAGTVSGISFTVPYNINTHNTKDIIAETYHFSGHLGSSSNGRLNQLCHGFPISSGPGKSVNVWMYDGTFPFSTVTFPDTERFLLSGWYIRDLSHSL